MGVYAVEGAKFFIGQALAAKTTDFVEADFNVISWTEVNWLENLGSFGDEATEVLFEPIAPSRAQKLKGTRNAGNQELVFGFDPEDDGQTALLVAEKSKDDFAFRVVFDDAPVGGTPSERLYIGKVMMAREQLDTANNVIRLNVRIGINSNVVRIEAAA